MFNVEDKRNLAMEGEVFFQDVEVESSKVDENYTLKYSKNHQIVTISNKVSSI
jgi:hypothetical protein